jgi:hypothetical protein
MARKARVGRSGAALLALGVCLASCGTSRAAGGGGGVSAANNNCGSAYSLLVGAASFATACGGTIPARPSRVTVKQGERFTVKSATETSGKADFPVLMPRGGAVRLVSGGGPTAHYVAAHAGKEQLLARSRYCERPRRGECIAFVVTVA